MSLLRRDVLSLIGGLAVSPALAVSVPGPDAPDAYHFAFDRLEGGRIALEAYRGKPILIVNTATNCGYAGQFASLEQLWQRYSGRGLMLLAVPSNDFGGQEPLEGMAIAESARQVHGATYPFAAKSTVRGPDAHPFYRWAAARRPAEVPTWNFHKYLIGRDGDLVGGFAAGTDPVSQQLVRAIGQQLHAA
ncbi:glutathione peroxidase [Bosea sp. BK604]|uniref:glutathione peroxidase n=1 Tax=Bosea sp. BK604 TaxID=2512180 RepID=UPI0010500848|nr:glutathione peroxidase [Bosea sp. BK604]TCR69641.1 glutathione peroxidase [Bosea sp. BK604]